MRTRRRRPPPGADRRPRQARELDAERARVRRRRGGQGEGARRGVPVLGRPQPATACRRPGRGHAAAPLFASTASSRSATRTRGRLESLELCGDSVDEAALERARVAAESANAARDLQNLPANVVTPSFLAERAGEIAAEHEALEIELLDREAIVAHGMGAFASVARGIARGAAVDRAPLPAQGGERAAPRLRRQGGDLRHRRDLHQARREDARDEVRHVGRCRRDRSGGGASPQLGLPVP